MAHDTLPKWLQGRNIVKVSYRGCETDHASTDSVPIRPRVEDRALLVGDAIGIQIMQETLDREGIGKARTFDANATGGKGRRRITEAETKATKVAQGIER